MTDDFQLFADPDDGGRAIDPDLALISAYLARELSPMQVLAVEERLANDAEFRAAMQPLIDAWAAPVSSLAGSASRVAPLTAREKAESWRRFQQAHPADESVTPNTNRKVSMKRVAALIGLTALPVVSFAQIVAYAAKHQDAPGHAIATRIVSTFTTTSPVAPATTPPIVDASKPAPSVEDVPLGKALNAPPPVRVQKAPAAAELLPAPMNPDRARIAALVKEHQARVAAGDTVVDYVVMVVDASDKYLWSTIGSGSLQFEVAGDTRTPAERRAYNTEFRKELMGNAARMSGARGGGGGGGGGGFGRGGAPLDSTRIQAMAESLRSRYPAGTGAAIARGGGGGVARGGGGGGGGGRARGSTGDTIVLDSATIAKMRKAVLPFVLGRTDSGGVARGYFAKDTSGPGNQPGTYRAGWIIMGNAPQMNSASGLQEPGNGESGIQGIRSASIGAADAYQFPAGELAPKSLRVIVVRLVAGTNWRRRF